jgi:hypothetical protein
MPKVTRKQKAVELRCRLENGPAFGFPGQEFTPEIAARDFRIWCNSWILPVVDELVPELRKKKNV